MKYYINKGMDKIAVFDNNKVVKIHAKGTNFVRNVGVFDFTLPEMYKLKLKSEILETENFNIYCSENWQKEIISDLFKDANRKFYIRNKHMEGCVFVKGEPPYAYVLKFWDSFEVDEKGGVK